MQHYKMTQDGNVFTIDMIDHENDNTLSGPALDELNGLLDQLENYEGNAALVLTSSHPKTFSTGINLAWLKAQTNEDQMGFLHYLDRTLLRLATLNMPTVAAINGNCYAGGALVASCFDVLYMREDRGRFCFPEVNIDLPFTVVMDRVVKLLPNPKATYWLGITGDAWGADKCIENNIIQGAVPLDQLHATAIETAKVLAEKPRETYTIIKREYRGEVTALALEAGLISPRPVRESFFS